MALALGAAVGGEPPKGKPAQASCAPDASLSYLCGITNPEDLAMIPGTGWLAAGAFIAAPEGGLYAIDTTRPSLVRLYPAPGAKSAPDLSTYPDCTTPPDPAKFSALGLSIRPREGAAGTLYVVGGGSRDAIEVFALDMVRGRPRATWKGCVKAPAGATLNGVAGLANGEILTTAIFEAPKTFKDVMAGQITGNVYFRAAGKPFAKVPGTEMSGPNGIEVTRDHRWMFVAETGKRRVLRYDRTDVSRAPDIVPLPFGPDNLRWTADHRLLAAGQERTQECGGPNCPPLANVTAIDPASLATANVLRVPVTKSWSGLSGAAIVHSRIWLGSHGADRIASVPIKP